MSEKTEDAVNQAQGEGKEMEVIEGVDSSTDRDRYEASGLGEGREEDAGVVAPTEPPTLRESDDEESDDDDEEVKGKQGRRAGTEGVLGGARMAEQGKEDDGEGDNEAEDEEEEEEDEEKGGEDEEEEEEEEEDSDSDESDEGDGRKKAMLVKKKGRYGKKKGGKVKRKRRGGFLTASMVDDEAAESGGESEEEGGGRKGGKKGKRRMRKQRGSSSEDESEGGEEENEYVHDDFVVPDEVAAEEEQRAAREARKARGSSSDDSEEEAERRKKRRRIKRTDVEEVKGELEELVDEDRFDEEEEARARRAEAARLERRGPLDEEDYESDDSWLVRDYEDEDMARRRKARSGRRADALTNVDQDLLEDLMAVFPEEEEDEEDEEGEEEAGEAGLEGGEGRRRRGGKGGVEGGKGEGREGGTLARMEPALLKEHFLTAEDERIRREDVPERAQAVGFGHKRRTRVLDEIEREEEAEWMLEQLRLPYGGDRSKQREAVKKVLEFLQVDLYDVPFLWAYRRDYFAPHLPDRAHLWSITRLDDKWEELQRRKSFALARFERFSAGHHGYSSRKAMDQEARKAALQEVEARLKEAEAGVEEWKEKVKTLQEKEDTRMIGGDDEEEDEFAEESASLPQAKEALASFTDQKEAALNDLAALEAEMEAAEREKEKRESNGQWEELEPVEEEEEEELRRLCPDSYRTMLDASREEEGVRDLHEYLGVIGQETSRRAHRLAFDLYRKCRSLKGLRRFASLFSCPAPELGAALHASSTSGGDLDEQHRPLIPTPNMYPENAAAEYTTPSLPKYEEVLRAAKHMLAMELAHEPRLRACFRQIYRAEATLTTHPTIKGHNEITDQFHRLHGFQFINKKPLYEFLQPPSDSQPDLFLRIMQAEREGFITFTIDAPANTAAESTSWTPNGSSAWPSLLQTLEGLYMPYRTASLDTSLVDAWNEQRKDILSLTLSSHILPMLEAEVKREMARKAQEAVVAAAADALREVVNTGTYMPQYRNINCALIPPFEDFQLRLSQRFPFELTPLSSSSLEVVAVFQASSRQEASFAVSVGRDGAVRDYVMLPPLRSGYDGDADQRDKLQKIIVEAKPAVVVVNAVVGGYEALRMKERLAKVVDNVARLYQHGELAAEDEEGWEPCEVLLIDDHLASVYARSPRVKKEFTDYHDNLRIAIGMARQMQDPLALVTLIYAAQDPRGGRFGGPGYQLSYLSLHDLQDQVNPHELSRRWEEVLVDAVNDVGVDLNKSISSLHLAGLLPFVSGLGFRKANALRAAIRNTHGSLVVSRAQLIEEGLLTPKVYENAAGFLRIRVPHLMGEDGVEEEDAMDLYEEEGSRRRGRKKKGRGEGRGERKVNLLDNTRIHPECYLTHEWVGKVIRDAMEQADPTMGINELVRLVMQDSFKILLATLCPPSEQGRPIDRLLVAEIPDELASLNLEEFANYLENTGNGKHYQQMDQIKQELRFPFRDPRAPFRGISEDKLFELVSGETDATLRSGMPVTGRVWKVDENAARVRLDQCVVTGYLHRSRYPNMQRDMDFEAMVPVDTPVEGVVTEIEKSRISVRISCLAEDLTARDWPRPPSLPPLDRHFDEARALKEYEERRRKIEEKVRLAKEGKLRLSRRQRKVDDERWRTVNHLEAEKVLKQQGKVGEWLFRPSGSGSISLSWLALEDLVLHIPVKEEEKEAGDAVGKKLTVQGRVYQELDQIVAQYIQPMNDLIDSVTSHRKFRRMAKEQVEAELRASKKKHPSQVFYLYYPDPRRPGSFKMAHIVKHQIFGEPVDVTPRGLSFRNNTFRSCDEVSDYFKEHFRDAVSLSSSSTSTAMPPTDSSTLAPAPTSRPPSVPPPPPPSAPRDAVPPPPPPGLPSYAQRPPGPPQGLPSYADNHPAGSQTGMPSSFHPFPGGPSLSTQQQQQQQQLQQTASSSRRSRWE